MIRLFREDRLIVIQLAIVLALAIGLGGLAVVCAVLAAAPASAQDAAPAAASWGPFAGEVTNALVLALAAPIAALLVRLLALGVSRIGFDLDERRRARLQEIVEAGILGAATRRGVSLRDGLPQEVRDELVGEAVLHVADFGAETVAKLKGKPDDLDQLTRIVEARAGLLLQTATR